MVEFVFIEDSSNGGLKISTYDEVEFQETIDFLKSLGAKWNKTNKLWEFPIVDYENYIADLNYEKIDIEISDYVITKYRDYINSLIELRVSPYRRIPRWDLMKYPPLKGIAPNELYQSIDCARALTVNRFLFHWEMGLGKSYALAFQIENMRYYKMLDRCIIFTTGVGVYNLKEELCKLGNNITRDEIFAVNSVQKLEDRHLFDKEKYPYRILIMTYDTFKYISDFYYDEANAPKTLPKKVAETEILLKEATKRITAEIKTEAEYQKLSERKTKDKYVRDKLKDNNEIKNIKKKLKEYNEGLHPSRNTDYQKSPLPLGAWYGRMPGAVFMDECHIVSNPTSLRSKCIDMNLKYWDYRYLYTGTLADKYEKLYMPLHVLDRSLTLGKPYQAWLKEYNSMNNKWSEYAPDPDGWNIGKLNELNNLLLAKYATKRKMVECLDLPVNYDVPTINLDMGELHRKIYEEFVKEELKLAQERKLTGEATVKDSIMNMFGIFQLACENVECLKDSPSFEKFNPGLQKMINDYDWFIDNTKVPAIEAVCNDMIVDEGKRGIVWYYHPRTKDNLARLLEKYNPIIIEAGMGPEAISQAIAEFKKDEKHKIIIGSINIMNTSVTLTECKWNLYVERTFNYTIYSQSRGRIYRPGQTEMCLTYMLCFNNSIDNLQLQNLKQKGAIIESLLTKSTITSDVWKMIFNATGNEKW